MVEQIKHTYYFPPWMSQPWIENKSILLLLDDLDDVSEVARSACIAEINAYHLRSLTPLVVCSRTATYESAAQRQRLQLQNAVVVQPLTSKEIEAVLDQRGQAVAGLRTTLCEQPALQELATTPLMLSVLLMTYQNTTPGLLAGANLEKQVWTDSIQRVIHLRRNGRVGRISSERMLTGLRWLAHHLRLHHQQIFYIEQLQPDWLAPKLQRTYHILETVLLALPLGILAAVFIECFFSETDINISTNVGNASASSLIWLQIVLLGAFLGGWLSPLARPGSGAVAGSSSLRRPSLVFLLQLFSSLGLGVFFIFSVGLSVQGIVFGAGIGLSGFLFSWFLPRSPQSLAPRWTRLGGGLPFPFLRSIHLYRALVIALVWGCIFTVGNGLRNGLACSLGPSGGISYGLSFGVTGWLLSFLRAHEERTFRLAERLYWNWRSLVDRRQWSTSLRIAGWSFLLFGVSDFLSDGLSGGWLYGLMCGFSTGVGYGLISGSGSWLFSSLAQGIDLELIEDQKRRTFNLGMHRSFFNSIWVSVLVVGIIMIVSACIFGGVHLLYLLLLSEGGLKVCGSGSDIWSSVLNALSGHSWLLMMSALLLLWALVGGSALLRHVLIRWLLARDHILPWAARAFLDEAADAHILLNQTRGGYGFLHRRLQDFFADAFLSER